MSYSISELAPTKDELEVKIRDSLSQVPVSQPVHEADIDQAFNAMKSLLDLVVDGPARDIRGSVAGSIWKTEAGVQQVSLNIELRYWPRA